MRAVDQVMEIDFLSEYIPPINIPGYSSYSSGMLFSNPAQRDEQHSRGRDASSGGGGGGGGVGNGNERVLDEGVWDEDGESSEEEEEDDEGGGFVGWVNSHSYRSRRMSGMDGDDDEEEDAMELIGHR